MAKIIKTEKNLGWEGVSNIEERLWLYCGLDGCLTSQLLGILKPTLEPETTERTYRFSRAMLGPALTMMKRGIRVDNAARLELLGEEQARRDKVATFFKEMCLALCDKDVNPASHQQLKWLFYEVLECPQQTRNDKGEWKVTVNEKALEKLAGEIPRAALFAHSVLRIRQIDKVIQVLHSIMSPDGRSYCSYNVVGTENGRFNSSINPFGEGTNHQNITKKLRRMWVADPGKIIVQTDLKSAESIATGFLAGDWDYVDACLNRDIHAFVAAQLFRIDESEVRTQFLRDKTYRDIAKNCGHGTHYMLTPKSMSEKYGVPNQLAIQFNLLYLGGELAGTRAINYGWVSAVPPHEVLHDAFKTRTKVLSYEGKVSLIEVAGAFSKIKRWQEDTIAEVQTNGFLITPFGRRRTFWGHRNDQATLREAVAFRPQSIVVDYLNYGLRRAWSELEPVVQVLQQGHDSFLSQVDIADADVYIRKIVECLDNEIEVNGRPMKIPVDVKIGYCAYEDKEGKYMVTWDPDRPVVEQISHMSPPPTNH